MMAWSEKKEDHFLIGADVVVDGDRGVIESVTVHTVDDDGERETRIRCEVKVESDGSEYLKDVDSSRVRVVSA